MNDTLKNSEIDIFEEEKSEISLITQCLTGDSIAFAQLMKIHIKYVDRIVQKYIWQKEIAEEVVQEVFVKVWRNLSGYDVNKKFTTWIYRITVNCCYDYLRKNKRIPVLEDLMDEREVKSVSNSQHSDGLILTKELEFYVRKFINELSNKQKIIYTMIDIENNSIEETSEIMGMSYGSVKTNLSYARKSIRMKIKKYMAG
jgi:RNA polymerase sigma-70 factor (ECF subfamily)